MTEAEAAALAEQLDAWVATLPPRRREALGEILARAAAVPTDAETGQPRARLLPALVYDRFFDRLQALAPDLGIPST